MAQKALMFVICGLIGEFAFGQDVRVMVSLGERRTNTVVQTRVALPVMGPAVIPPKPLGTGMVGVVPTMDAFGPDDPVLVDVEIDLHGAEGGRGVPPAMVLVNKKTKVFLDFEVTAIPMSSYLPSGFFLDPNTAPVPFEFRGVSPGVIYDYIMVEPAGAPVDVRYQKVGIGEALNGTVAVLANPPSSACDGVVHNGKIIAVTKGGDADFFRFQWRILPVKTN